MNISRTDRGNPDNAPVRIYPPNKQASGSFDDGRITEIKPIGFPGEGSAVTRIGPLFYWAWASADGPATIALHPHKGFEIASYVLQGEIGHFDTGGHESRIGQGGVQVMQTGSGISHEERTFQDATEFFQIWFEPNLREAVRRPPEYRQATDAELPATESGGVRVKTIIGGKSPINLVTDARLEYWTFAANATLALREDPARTQAMVVVNGDFALQHGAERHLVQARDFVVLTGGLNHPRLEAGKTGGEVMVVDVPTVVSYPLLEK